MSLIAKTKGRLIFNTSNKYFGIKNVKRQISMFIHMSFQEKHMTLSLASFFSKKAKTSCHWSEYDNVLSFIASNTKLLRGVCS